jgi:hypothetical protein
MTKKPAKGNSEEPKQINVTSHGQRGGITAGIVNIGTEPGIESEVLAQNEVTTLENDTSGYVCRFRVKILRAFSGTGLWVEAVEGAGNAVDLRVGPDGIPAVMMTSKREHASNHKSIEIHGPLIAAYGAAITASQPLTDAKVLLQVIP